MINEPKINEDLSSILLAVKEKTKIETRVATVGYITKVSVENRTLNMQPIIQEKYTGKNKQVQYIKLPELLNVPYLSALGTPKVNEYCIVLHLDRSLNGLNLTQPPKFINSIGNFHNLSDGIALFGFNDLSGKVVKLYDTLGDNTDGALTQKFASSELKTKLTKSQILDLFYPVGTIYITSSWENRPAIKWGGTWELIDADKTLWSTTNADNNQGSQSGKYIDAGLPNITGVIGNSSDDHSSFITGNKFEGTIYDYGGALTAEFLKSIGGFGNGNGWANKTQVTFDASRSNSIYGSSTTVQPPAYVVYMWHRIEDPE